MSSPDPEAMRGIFKIILSKEKEVAVQQWQGDALDDNARGRLRHLSDRFPPATQENFGLREVASRLNDVFLHSVKVDRKRKAANETPSEEEEDTEEEEEEEEDPKHDTISAYELRNSRSQSSTNHSSKARDSNDTTTPTTPERKVPRTSISATSKSRGRQPSCPATPSSRAKSTSIMPVHNGFNTWAAIRKLPMRHLHKGIAMHLELALFLIDRGSLLLFQPKAAGVRSIQEGLAAILLYHKQMTP